MISETLLKFARQNYGRGRSRLFRQYNMASVASSTERRVFAISDIHVDHVENKNFLQNLDPREYRSDALILAGDVTDNMQLLEETLLTLKAFFKEVCFVPGNHDLWIRDKDSVSNSHEKFFNILKLCDRLEVRTKPFKFNSCNPVWIIPLFSWYSTPEDHLEDSLYIKPTEGEEDTDMNYQMWMDNHLCKWPEGSQPQSLYFSSLNAAAVSQTFDAPVISFSHFLPRKDLILATDHDRMMVDKERQLMNKQPSTAQRQGGVKGFNFTRYAGCQILESQIRKLSSVVHVYGHQHRNRDREIDGVRYVSHCLGYPSERKEGWTWGMVKWMGPKLIWK